MTRGMFCAIKAAKARTARYRHVVSYGSSMGGFAALKYSLVLGCTSAIAAGPSQRSKERCCRHWTIAIYAEFLEAIGNPKHECHAEFKEWLADDFDPNLVDAGWLAEEVTTLAKRWSRKPVVKRPRGA